MFRSRASRLSARAALVAILLLTSAAPASAVYDVHFDVSSSPFVVTVGLPVAYPVSITNNGGNTLNHVTITGHLDAAFVFHPELTVPDAACSDTEPRCDFDQLKPGDATAEVIFYYYAPATVGTYTFTAQAQVSQGSNDDGNPGNGDSFTSQGVVTNVVATSPDLVAGHSVPGIREFSTGLIGLGTGNPHGTLAVVPTNAEVTLSDLPPAPGQCPAGFTTCFGWASSLSIGGGAEFPAGIRVTVRWDYSELPSGLTLKKLRIAHIFDPPHDPAYEFVSAQCTFVAGIPQNMPCLDGLPVKLADKDIQASMYLLTNGLIKGL